MSERDELREQIAFQIYEQADWRGGMEEALAAARDILALPVLSRLSESPEPQGKYDGGGEVERWIRGAPGRFVIVWQSDDGVGYGAASGMGVHSASPEWLNSVHGATIAEAIAAAVPDSPLAASPSQAGSASEFCASDAHQWGESTYPRRCTVCGMCERFVGREHTPDPAGSAEGLREALVSGLQHILALATWPGADIRADLEAIGKHARRVLDALDERSPDAAAPPPPPDLPAVPSVAPPSERPEERNQNVMRIALEDIARYAAIALKASAQQEDR